nr:hypothetical protein [Mycobacterium sp. 29Ha]
MTSLIWCAISAAERTPYLPNPMAPDHFGRVVPLPATVNPGQAVSIATANTWPARSSDIPVYSAMSATMLLVVTSP